jgi:hypothetical protein
MRLRPRLSYANVTATLALIIALGGTGAFAATQLARNSVGPKQIKKNAVTAAKIRKNAITGAKVKDRSLTGKDIDLGKLGTVPSANVANSANALAPLEATHLVGAPGEPQFENGSTNFGSEGPFTYSSVGFYKDHEGVVHLEGVAKVDSGPSFVSVFTLPPGYRPPPGGDRPFEQVNELLTVIGADGRVLAREEGAAALEGIAFRAGS